MFQTTPLQSKLFPCDDKYSEKEISDLKKSWAEVVKNKVLPFLGPLEFDFAKFYHKTMGRPIRYIALLIVVHVFKEMYDWSDEELLANVRFDKRFEYAFDIPYDKLTLCQKTLHNFRHLIQTYDLARTIFQHAVSHIVESFNIDTQKQRLDSTHVISNIARLSRLALFVRVIENFLNKLKKLVPETYDSLPVRFTERYGKRRGYFADARSKKTKHRLGEAANDMYYLLDRFAEHEALVSLKVTEHLKRVFQEHCSIRQARETSTIEIEVPEDDLLRSEDLSEPAEKSVDQASAETSEETENQVVVKDPKEMSSGTLQNPADEDVTCGYKGPGYEATFAETCSPENPFQVITDVQVDPSDQSDQHKTLQVVERLEVQNLKPEMLHTDGVFTSGENIVECAEKGVNLQGNLVGVDKHPEKLKLADFKFAQDGITVTACPTGESSLEQKPQKSRQPKTKPQESFRVYFLLEVCKNCASKELCPVTLQKKKAVLLFSRAQLAASFRRREQQTEAFKERNKIRAGIESTNAEMKKSQGLGRLNVRGQPCVNQTVIFKALACNIKRMVKYVQSVQKMELSLENAVNMSGNLAIS